MKYTVFSTIDAFYPYSSGSANHAFMLSKGLEDKKIYSPILTSNFGAEKCKRHEKIRGVHVFRFPIKWRFMRYFYTPELKSAFEESRGSKQIICAHAYRNYQSEIAFDIAKKRKLPFIIHPHGCLLGYRKIVRGFMKLPYILYDVFCKKIILDADAVIVNSKQEYDEAVDFGVKRDKIKIIPFSIDADKYAPCKKDNKELTLLWVGRITRDRNIELIIRAVKLFQNQAIRLIIVGNEFRRTTESQSELTRLKCIAKELEISDKIRFVPWTEKKAISEFKKADLFIYTSISENFGQSILEAAAAGLPLICTNVGIAPDLIINGKTGRIIKNMDPAEVAKAMIEFSNKTKRKIAEKMLITKIKKEYSREKIIGQYLELFNELTNHEKT